MKNLIILLLLLSQFGYLRSQTLEELSVKQLQEDFQVFRGQLEKVHPGLYTYSSKEKLYGIFEEIKARLNEPMSQIDFYRALLPILRPIGNNHTEIQAPDAYNEQLINDLPRFPFRLYHDKAKLYVLEDLSREQEIGVGAVITRMNGRDILEIFEEMKALYRVDGFNESSPNWALSVVFSRKYAQFFGTPTSYDLEYVDQKGKKKRTTISGIPQIELQEAAQNLKTPNLFGHGEKYQFKFIEDVAYLKIASFQPEKARTYISFLKDSFKKIKEKGSQKLILDLRNNGGGYPEASYKLLAYLIKESIRPAILEYAKVDKIEDAQYYEKDFFFKHFHKQNLIWRNGRYEGKAAPKIQIKPEALAFDGELIVLINARSSSATGELLGQIKTHTNASFIGTEAGGNCVTQVASDLLTLVLPHSGIKVTLPAIKSLMRVNFENTGHGVQPDIEILPSVQDLWEERDVVLEKALEKG
ncbi:MAG: S41 family peptidase [Bacteroidia bacterium]|nr:S41 family peptidase [Bacteroidia bacterium]